MAKKLPTIWSPDRHTLAKHAILRRYLQAWIPIMTRRNRRVVYVDGFAGPGVYESGEDGSPIIALKTALGHAPQIRGECVFVFIEEDTKRLASLQAQLARLEYPKNFSVMAVGGRCDYELIRVLDEVDRDGGSLAPTFAFLDPLGYKDIPLHIVQRILKHQRCEVLITFMYEEINRFISHPEQPSNFDALFGCPGWRRACTLVGPSKRREFLHDLYRHQLQNAAGATYVRSFQMLNQGNRTDYFLFFATRSIDGLKKMKEAMWKVDEMGGIQFSDATDPRQMVLFDGGPEPGDLRRRLQTEFRGRIVSVDDIENFVVVHTPYRETHFKRQVLKPMELDIPPEIKITDAPGRRIPGTYPSGTMIEFLKDLA